jgi:regulator of replication initiation timing
MSMERLPEGQYDANDKENQLDHSRLSNFIRSENGHRDLSATVSCLNEVVKDLIRQNNELKSQNDELKKRVAAIEAAIAKVNEGGKL